MGNCLVTKFNGVVNNDNLDIYDTITITVDGNNTGRCISVQGSPDVPLEISWTGGTLYTRPERDIPRESPIIVTNASVIDMYVNEGTTLDVKIKGIYNLRGIGFDSSIRNIKGASHISYAPISEFVRDYTSTIKGLNLNGVNRIILRNLDGDTDFTLNVGAYTSTIAQELVIQYLRANNLTGVSGSIEGITNRCPNITRIQLPHTKVTGNIANIGSYDKIRLLIVSGTNCTGTVESFVEGVATKSTFQDYCYFEAFVANGITLNGNPFNSCAYIFKSGNVINLYTETAKTTLIASYNISTGTWTYNV